MGLPKNIGSVTGPAFNATQPIPVPKGVKAALAGVNSAADKARAFGKGLTSGTGGGIGFKAPAPRFATPGAAGKAPTSPKLDAWKNGYPTPPLEQPGAGEDYWDRYAKDFFSAPSQSGDYWNRVAGQFSTPRRGPNYAQQGYADFRQNFPTDPNLDPYYDMQYRRAADDINKGFGARGMFNSSEATNTLARTRGDLAAMQAKEEADYAMRTSQLGQGWANAASGEASTNIQNDLARLLGGTQAAGAASSADTARASAGMTGSALAQGLKEGRMRGQLQDILSVIQGGLPTINNGYNSMIEGDAALLEEIQRMLLGIPREQANQSERNADKITDTGILAAETYFSGGKNFAGGAPTTGGIGKKPEGQ